MTAPDRSWITSDIDPTAFAALAKDLPDSAAWSLLLEVLAQRAAQRTPAIVQRQFERDGFVQPSAIDQRTLTALDGHLLAAASAFDALELSPLAPLGACSAIGLASQHKVVSALRGTEVVSDPTNVLALECARRLRENPERVVRLATCHQCVRAQALPKQPGFSRHFRIFCLATAGRERQDHAFLVDALTEQIATHLAALDRLEQHGYTFPWRRVTILATAARAHVGDRIASAVRGVPVTRGVLDHAYYDGGLRFQITVRVPSGPDVPFVDGGAFNWLHALTSNRKVTFVASGMGSQLAALLFQSSRGKGEGDRG